MRNFCVPLALATIFVVLIVHAPTIQAKALADADADADALADAISDAFADPGVASAFAKLGKWIWKLFKKAAPTLAMEGAIQVGTKIAEGKKQQ